MASPISQFFRDILNTIGHILRQILLYVAVFFILALLASSVGGVFSGWSSEPSSPYGPIIQDTGGDEQIIVLPIDGIILTHSTPSLFDASAGVITPDQIQDFFLKIQDDPLIKAVILDVNSPGGSPVASDRIFELIQAFRERTHLPVVVVMGDIATSGGYYISAAADHIVANPATLTGSIGVILETYDLQGLYEKIGVQKRTFKEGEYKDLLNEARDLTEEEEAIIQNLTENTYNMFVSRIAEGRAIPEAQVKALATGQIYSGRQAKDLNLVDSLGNLDEAIYQAKALANLERYQVIEYSSESFFGELFAELSTHLTPWLRTPLLPTLKQY